MANGPFSPTPWGILNAFLSGVIGDVADVAATYDTVNRSDPRYFIFDDVFFDAIPTTPGPCIRARVVSQDFTRTRQVGGFAESGSIGSWLTTFEMKVYGDTGEQAYNEVDFIQTALENVPSNPPVRDHRKRLIAPGLLEHNKKRGWLYTFVVPLTIPTVPAQHGHALVLTASAGINLLGNLSGSFSGSFLTVTQLSGSRQHD